MKQNKTNRNELIKALAYVVVFLVGLIAVLVGTHTTNAVSITIGITLMFVGSTLLERLDKASK